MTKRKHKSKAEPLPPVPEWTLGREKWNAMPREIQSEIHRARREQLECEKYRPAAERYLELEAISEPLQGLLALRRALHGVGEPV